MQGTLQLPAWLVDFWTIYGDMITPVLVTFCLAIVTSIALKIKTDARVNSEKANLQIQALKDVANREDNKPELEAQRAQIDKLSKAIEHLSEMFAIAFENSNLNPEIKDNIVSILNKIKYGTEDDLVKELKESNSQLKEQIAKLMAEGIDKVTVKVAEQETKTRTRR